MLKVLKFKGPEYNFLFWSDMHIFHNRVWIVEKREFKTIEEHDNTLIHNYNSIATNQTTFFHLGDFIFNDPNGDKFWQTIRRLKFKELYLLWGNHTSGQRQAYVKNLELQFPNLVKDNQIIAEVYPLRVNFEGRDIIFLPQYVEIVINSDVFILCHYPLYSFNDQSRQGTMLSGHVHGNCKLTNKNTGVGRRLDLGVEEFKFPATLTEIKNILKDRDIDSVDHHGDSTA